MAYRIEFTRRAERDLASLPSHHQARIAKAIDALAINPRPRGVRKLVGGDDLYRVRAGDYRIVYRIEDDRLTVLIIRVGHRRDIYR